MDAEVASITEGELRITSPAASRSPTTMMGSLRMVSPASSGKRLPPPPSRPQPPKRVKSEEDQLRMEVLLEQLRYYRRINEELDRRQSLEKWIAQIKAT